MGDKYDFKQFDLTNPTLSIEINKINNSIIFNDVNFRTTDDDLLTENDSEDKIKKNAQTRALLQITNNAIHSSTTTIRSGEQWDML